MNRILLAALGYGFLLLGIVGLVLPVLQGVLFIVVGLLILSRSSPWARRLLEHFRSRHPAADRIVGEAERLMRRAVYRVRVLGRRFFYWLRA